MVIHEADHAVVGGDIPPEFPFVVQVTVAAVSGVWPVPVAEVRLPLLGFGEVGRVAIVLSGRQPAGTISAGSYIEAHGSGTR